MALIENDGGYEMEIIEWFKKLFVLVSEYDYERARMRREMDILLQRILAAENVIIERTRFHADVHLKGEDSAIIVVGRYRDRDYVKVFNVDIDKFSDLVDHLKELERYAKRGKLDVPPLVDAVIKREL